MPLARTAQVMRIAVAERSTAIPPTLAGPAVGAARWAVMRRHVPQVRPEVHRERLGGRDGLERQPRHFFGCCCTLWADPLEEACVRGEGGELAAARVCEANAVHVRRERAVREALLDTLTRLWPPDHACDSRGGGGGATRVEDVKLTTRSAATKRASAAARCWVEVAGGVSPTRPSHSPCPPRLPAFLRGRHRWDFSFYGSDGLFSL